MEKKEKNVNLNWEKPREDIVAIRFLSKFIRNILAAFPTVTLRLRHYNSLMDTGANFIFS